MDATMSTIWDFITKPNQNLTRFMITVNKAGAPYVRQVSCFVEPGFVMGTIGRLPSDLKMVHLKNNPAVTMMWVELGRTAAAGGAGQGVARNVCIEGRAELVTNLNDVNAFLRRRSTAQGAGDVVPPSDYDRYLMKIKPVLLRAEGFVGSNVNIVTLRDFQNPDSYLVGDYRWQTNTVPAADRAKAPKRGVRA